MLSVTSKAELYLRHGQDQLWGTNGIERDVDGALKNIRAAADMAYPPAMHQMGYLCEKGEITAYDRNAAIHWYSEAAKQNYAPSMCALAILILSGAKEDADAKDALRLLRKAEKQNLSLAQFHLAQCLMGGIGVQADAAAAVKYYQKAAKQGHAEAQYMLGNCYANGLGVAQNAAEAVSWFQQAAQQHVPAMTRMGRCCETGSGLEADPEAAIRWYRKAIGQGDALAQYYLAGMVENGSCSEMEPEQALQLYLEAAQKGIVVAQLAAAQCYAGGWGTRADPEKAVIWFRKAAEQGNSAAQWHLGKCFENGEGIACDPEQAARYYLMAAEQSYAPGIRDKGRCYRDGIGVTPDFDLSISCLEQAVKMGDAIAMKELAVCRILGVGVEKSIQEASALCMQISGGERNEAQLRTFLARELEPAEAAYGARIEHAKNVGRKPEEMEAVEVRTTGAEEKRLLDCRASVKQYLQELHGFDAQLKQIDRQQYEDNGCGLEDSVRLRDSWDCEETRRAVDLAQKQQTIANELCECLARTDDAIAYSVELLEKTAVELEVEFAYLEGMGSCNMEKVSRIEQEVPDLMYWTRHFMTMLQQQIEKYDAGLLEWQRQYSYAQEAAQMGAAKFYQAGAQMKMLRQQAEDLTNTFPRLQHEYDSSAGEAATIEKMFHERVTKAQALLAKWEAPETKGAVKAVNEAVKVSVVQRREIEAYAVGLKELGDDCCELERYAMLYMGELNFCATPGDEELQRLEAWVQQMEAWLDDAAERFFEKLDHFRIWSEMKDSRTEVQTVAEAILAAAEEAVDINTNVARTVDPAVALEKARAFRKEKQWDEVIRWLRRAAELGSAEAQNELAYLFERGRRVQQNSAEAFRLYRLSAEQGYSKAQCNLAICYEAGIGTEKSLPEAIRWYRIAAEQGVPAAQNKMGLFCFTGAGVEKSMEQAAEWFRKSAEQGYRDGCLNLCKCYQKGCGVQKDLEQAAYWRGQAAKCRA